MESFSSILSRLRKDRGFSQEDIATRLGVSIQAVSKWECAQNYPDITLLPALSEIFGVSIDYLLAGKNEKEVECTMPDDGKLRIVQFLGNRLLTRDDYDPDTRIMLMTDGNLTDSVLNAEIWGSADISGSISGGVSCGGNLNCEGDINGGVYCSGVLQCNSNINGAVRCDGNITINGANDDEE